VIDTNQAGQKEDFERLRPSHKADYRTVVGDLALKREECTPGTRVKILEDITNWANNLSHSAPVYSGSLAKPVLAKPRLRIQ
jgi:hypothetical protein